MGLQDKNLNPPKDIAETVSKEAQRAEAFTRARRLTFGDDKTARVESDLFKKIDSWKKQTAAMRRRLVRLNELIEGVVEETNFPFEGASNITLHYAAGIQATFRSTFNRTMYQDPNLFTATTSGQTQLPAAGKEALEAAQNHTFASESNGLTTLKGLTNVIFRDGTGIVSGAWERRIEQGNDARIYTKASDFQVDYPDAATAGVEQAEYDGILDQFLIDPELELRVSFSYDFVQYDGTEYDIVPFANFVHWPVTSQSLSRMELYGKQFMLTESELKLRGKRGAYYAAAVERLCAAVSASGQRDEWSASRNFIEGLAPQLEENKPIECYSLVYKADLDGDSVPEKYIATFAFEAKVLLSIEKYPIRRNIDNCVPFRFVKRDGRFAGVSLLGDTEDLFRLMDGIHRNRNNVRALTVSPMFLADKNQKEEIDLGRNDNLIRPGVTFWVKDPQKEPLKQLVIQDLSRTNNDADEEERLTRYIELRIGATQALSGRESQADPRAPMGKTLALLNQANQRIDDYMDEVKESMPAIAELHNALYFQYGPEMTRFTVEKDGKPAAYEIPRSLFGTLGVRWELKRRSVTLSPEFSMARLSGLLQTYTGLLPLLMAGNPQAIEMWNRMVTISGEPDAQKLLMQPPPPGAAMIQQALAAAAGGQQQNGQKKQGATA